MHPVSEPLTIKLGDRTYIGVLPNGAVGLRLAPRAKRASRAAGLLAGIFELSDDAIESVRKAIQARADIETQDDDEPRTVTAAEARGVLMSTTVLERAPTLGELDDPWPLATDTLAGWTVDGEAITADSFGDLYGQPGRWDEPWIAVASIWLRCGFFIGGLASIASATPDPAPSPSGSV